MLTDPKDDDEQQQSKQQAAAQGNKLTEADRVIHCYQQHRALPPYFKCTRTQNVAIWQHWLIQQTKESSADPFRPSSS
jgi:hypothetical protein